MVSFLRFLINGISLGSVYAIIALGYTMVYGIAKMLNFAHGDVIMVGAYIAFCAMSYLSLPPLWLCCAPWWSARCWACSSRAWPTGPCARLPSWPC